MNQLLILIVTLIFAGSAAFAVNDPNSLTSENSPATQSFKAYELYENGDIEGAQSLLKQVAENMTDELAKGVALGYMNKDTFDEESMLYALRFTVESDQQNQIEIPCTLFAKHPQYAYKAFNAYWGSSRDSFLHCSLESYQQVLPHIFKLEKEIDARDNVQGSRVHAYNRITHTYMVKAIISPEVSLEGTGLTAYDVTSLTNENIRNVLGLSVSELASFYETDYGMELNLAQKRAKEVLHSYVGYRLSKGSITQ